MKSSKNRMAPAAALLLVVAAPVVFGRGATATSAQAFLRSLGAKAADGVGANRSVVRGRDGWLFFAPELRSLSVGQFWGPAAARVSRASSADAADPLPAILDFKAQLDRKHIGLILVPVPAKAIIYPDKIGSAGLASGGIIPRLDVYDQQFYSLLRRRGVNVLDLTSTFLQARRSGGDLYCKQDTHWSGRGCELAAGLIWNQLRRYRWATGVPKRSYVRQNGVMTLTGDLWSALGDRRLPKEKIPLTFWKEHTPDGLAPIAPWRQSPILLLGDSHNLIFHAGGDMQAEAAGLPDQIAALAHYPVDLVAVRGSGATPARINLMRRRDNLAGKKVVVWCFTVREFTEGQGWRKVPVIR